VELIKSPGQIRKSRTKIIVVCLFVFATLLGATATQHVSKRSLAWTNNAAKTTASITNIKEQTEEYRNLKGRKRYREIVTVDYKYSVEGETYSHSTEFSNPLDVAKLSQNLDLLYLPSSPNKHQFESQARSILDEGSLIPYLISAAPFSGALAYAVYLILSLFWVRESKKVLPKGFFRENCWLDVDDKYVVAIDEGNLVTFDIHKNKLSTVQAAFQQHKPVSDLVYLSGHSEIVILPLDEITKVTSDHNSDVVYVTHDEEEHSLEFLNVSVKNHALKRILPLLPLIKKYSKLERGRFESSLPALIGTLALVAIAGFIGSYIVNLIVGLLVITWLLPKAVSRLTDPLITRNWFAKPVTT